jgi:hypothetical protein
LQAVDPCFRLDVWVVPPTAWLSCSTQDAQQFIHLCHCFFAMHFIARVSM